MSESLAGRTAIVTGASRGIGLAIASALVAAGARVAMLARGREMLTARAANLGSAALAIPCDVADPNSVTPAVDAAGRAFGGTPDVLVNNAGLFMIAPLAHTEPSRLVALVHANLIGPFLLVRAVVPGMQSRGSGHVITIGSVADRTILPGNAAYAATKFGARAMHEVLRAETRGSGVRTTLVSPGATDTPMWDALDPDNTPAFTPRASMLRADAVADAVMFALTRPRAVNIDELRLSPA